MHEIFHYQNFFETQKGSPTNFFGTVRQKNSTQSSDIPFLCIKFFETPNFLKHWRVSHEIFWHCETNFLTEICDTPFYILCISFFPYKKSSQTQEGRFTKFLVLKQKIFDKTMMPSVLCMKVFDNKYFWNTEGFPYEFFRNFEIKKISTENNEIPFLSRNFFDTRNFLVHRIVTQQNFSVLWDKNFGRKVVILPPPLFCIKYRNQWWNSFL